MSKSIATIKVSFQGKNGETIRGLTIIPQGQYKAYQWWTQECHRFLAAHSAFGHHITTVLEGFVGGQQYQATHTHTYDSYNEYALLVLRVGPDDKRALKMGASKVKAILEHIKTFGLDAFVKACQEVAGQAEVKLEQSPKFGKKKGAGSRGQSLEQIEENTTPAPSKGGNMNKKARENVAPNSPAARKMGLAQDTDTLSPAPAIAADPDSELSALKLEKLKLYRRLLEIRDRERELSQSLVTA